MADEEFPAPQAAPTPAPGGPTGPVPVPSGPAAPPPAEVVPPPAVATAPPAQVSSSPATAPPPAQVSPSPAQVVPPPGQVARLPGQDSPSRGHVHPPPAYVPPPPGYVAPPPRPPFPRPGPPSAPINLWGETVWPVNREAAAPRGVLVAAAVAGAVGAMTLWTTAVPGIGFALTGLAVLATALATRRQWPAPTQAVTAACATGLLAVGAVRSAGWLFALCVCVAWAVGALAVAGGRTWSGLLLGVASPLLVPARATGWGLRGLVRAASGRATAIGRIIVVTVVTVMMLAVFGALFASADPAFADLVDAVIPGLSVPSLIGRAILFILVVAMAMGAARLAHLPPRFDRLAPGPGRPLPRWEWAVPVAMLDLLFLSFVILQLTVLFGGHGHVLGAGGPDYADYARQGFWQLTMVAVLTLAVVAVAVRKAGRTSRTDRLLVRLLLGVLCVLTAVILASALRRLWLYEEAYGFTRLRVWVNTVELWLGLVFALVLAAGVRLRGAWLPRAVVATGVATLLGLAVLNPDAYVADRNVDRFERTGKIDVEYLAGLSADAVPALDRLPEPQRSCALRRVAANLEDSVDEPWYAFNHARAQAREILSTRPVRTGPPCEETSRTVRD